MPSLVWRGDAQARAQITTLVPANVEIGDTFTVTINRKDITVTATAATVANVVALLVAAIGTYDNDIAEFKEISAAAATGSTHVILTGPVDGKPFTITTSTSNAGSFGVTVTTVTDGSAAVNEKQRIVLAGPPTGGTFTLTFNSETTIAIARNASAATVLSALEGLTTPVPGDFAVTLNATSDWTVEFTGAYAATNVALMTGNGASLTGVASLAIATTTQGAAGTNEVQRFIESSANATSYRVTFNGVNSAYISPQSSAATVQAALEAMSTIGSGNIVVTKSSIVTPGSVYASEYLFGLTFVGSLGFQNVSQTTTPDVGQFTFGILMTEGSSTGTNEVQTVTVRNAPTGGTFTLTFNAQTTSAQAFNESAANLQADLEALSTIGAGNVSVARSGSGTLAAPYVYTCTFQGTLASTDVAQMTGSAASLTGGAVNIATVQEASSAVNEVETVELTGGPTGGTYTLTFNAETTAGIAYNASAATVLAALEGLATPVPGDFTVTGAAGGPWTVTFTGAYAASNVTAMTGSGASLTGGGSQTLTASTTTTATGPNNWNDAENFSTGSLPANTDTVVIDDPNAGDILWNLDALSAVTLAKLVVRQSFANKRIGLSDHNGLYYEYRPVELKIGATSIEIGNGDGSGPILVRLDTQAVLTAIEVLNSGRSQDDSLKAVTWKGTHASNTAEILGGEFAAAIDQADVATLLTMRILASEVAGSAPNVFCGPGTTLGTVEADGGDVVLNSAIVTALTVNDGEVLLRGAGAVAQLNVLGGKVVYNTSGTLGGNTIVAGDGVLDFSQDMSTKTITNPIEVQSKDAQVNDPNKVTSGLVLDFNYVDVEINGMSVGRNRRITFGTPA